MRRIERITIRFILLIRCYIRVPALYETGGHRDLYSYLTRMMGLFVQPGRGPAWYRAQALIERYELLEKQTPQAP